MSHTSNDTIRAAVRDTYSQIALSDASDGCCGPTGSSCCGEPALVQSSSLDLGYATQDLITLPDGADLGLGCGTPVALADAQPGETVLDLGSGAGIDAFLMASEVGPEGRVIGVDMTPAMVSKARANAEAGHFTNVEFRLGEIEHLPVADGTVDVIISNCVVNLSPDKPAVFASAFRALRPGGRLAISDVVAMVELPDHIREDLSLYSSCVSGAIVASDLEAMMTGAGFEDVRITAKNESRSFIEEWAPGRSLADYVVSATIEAVKPGARAASCL